MSPNEPIALEKEYSGYQISSSIPEGNTARSCWKHPLFSVALANANRESTHCIVCSMTILTDPEGSDTDSTILSSADTATCTLSSPAGGGGGEYIS